MALYRMGNDGLFVMIFTIIHIDNANQIKLEITVHCIKLLPIMGNINE